jgi:uncharacterized protein YjiS (DUF1127 family)
MTTFTLHGFSRHGLTKILTGRTLLVWTDRALSRDHLARLSDHQLADVGLSRSDVEREAAKPFWRA